MADDDRYLTGGGELIPEQRSASYSTNTSLGPLSGGAILAGQDEGVPMYGGRLTAQLPEGLSATLSRTNQAGETAAYARDAIRLAKQLEAGQLALEASRIGSQGLPSYGLQYSGQIGREGGAPSYYPQPKGHWFVEAGGTPRTPERHVRGGARFNFADGGTVEDALHAVRHHLAGGGFLSDLFSGPDYLSTGETASPTNWGDPESAADFFKADRALSLAREAQARADDVTGSVPTAPRRQQISAPAPAPAPEPDVKIPFAAPESGVSMLSSDISPASITSLPLAYAPAPAQAPASSAIDQATGKMTARIPEEPNGTALTKQQADYVIRTIAAETSGKSPEETRAIASVILNRINSGKYGSSPEAVLFAKRQFEPWMNPAGKNYPMKISPTSQRYSDARDALEAAMAGEDITGGATNFWGPGSQFALGRSTPKFARDMPDYVDIGATRFHRPNRETGGSVDDALRVVREHHADGEAVGRDEDTYGPANIEERRARIQELTAPTNYPGDKLEAPMGYMTPATAVEWKLGDAGPYAVDASGATLPLIPQPGMLPMYRDPTIDSIRPAMPGLLDLAGNVVGAPLGITARRVLQAGITGERPAANMVNLFGGEKAKTANLDKFEDALASIDKYGVTPEQVRRETGWFEGPDKQWRFEIPDYRSTFDPAPLLNQQSRYDVAAKYFEQQGVPATKFATGQFPEMDKAALEYADKVISERPAVTLGQLLKHPEAYAAYPEAANIPVNINRNPNYAGSFNPATGEMAISIPTLGQSWDKARSTALHELQHYIQKIENFARGANTTFLKPGTPAWDLYQERIKKMSTVPTLKKYAKDAGFGDDLIAAKPSYDEHAASIKRGDWKKYDVEAQKSALEEAYLRSAGENEAGNVQTRRDMPPEELLRQSPLKTQKIPSNRQIVQFHEPDIINRKDGGSVEDRALMLVSKQA